MHKRGGSFFLTRTFSRISESEKMFEEWRRKTRETCRVAATTEEKTDEL